MDLTQNTDLPPIIDLSISAKRKRRILSVEEKVKIILEIEKGRRKSELCKEWEIKSSTLSTIWTNRSKYLEALEHLGKSGSKFKRLRRPDKFDIDEALLKWFKQQRNENIIVTGPILVKKAEHFAKLLGHNTFICNNGWIDRFKLRHDISFPKVKEHSEHHNLQISDWLRSVWPKFRDGYEDCDIFNADEIGLLFKVSPVDAANFSGEKFADGSFAKDRLTVLVCANATGSEKRKLTVVGNVENPKFFAEINYCYNAKSWISAEILQKILREWNKTLRLGSRKILLLLDNDISHMSLPVLSHIKYVYLPANSSSVFQPMEQGITKLFKYYYRKLILRKLATIDSYNLSEAVDNLEIAWNRISEAQISNSFQKSGFSINAQFFESDSNPNSDFDSYFTFDNNLLTSECQTEQEIVREVINKQDTHANLIDEKDDEGTEVNMPSLAEARQAARILTRFYDSQEVDPMIILQATNIENDLEKRFWAERGDR